MKEITKDTLLAFEKLLIEIGDVFKVQDNFTILNVGTDQPVTVVDGKKTKIVAFFYEGMPVSEDITVLNPFKECIGINRAREWFYNALSSLTALMLSQLMRKMLKDAVEKNDDNYNQFPLMSRIIGKVDETMLDELDKIRTLDLLSIYYNKKTKDILLYMAGIASMGEGSSMWINAGEMKKNGLATNIQPTSNQQATNITFDFQCFNWPQQPTTNQLPTNIQPTKQKKRTTKFTPPTDSEVAAFIAEKGYHFNPAIFVPWYQSKGWMVGRSPMKDWRASCRTWEIKWKKKYGEKYYYEVEPSLNRSALRDQDVRYSELERAAETVLRNAPYNDAAQND